MSVTRRLSVISLAPLRRHYLLFQSIQCNCSPRNFSKATSVSEVLGDYEYTRSRRKSKGEDSDETIYQDIVDDMDSKQMQTNISASGQRVGTGLEYRIKVDLSSRAAEYLEKNNLKPKSHPGVFHLPRISLPEKFTSAAEKILSHHNMKDIMMNSIALQNKLWGRQVPIEDHEYKYKVAQIEKDVIEADRTLEPFLSQKHVEELEKQRFNKIKSRLKRVIYHWEPIDFNNLSTVLQYLVGRTAGEYASLCKIFNEISVRNKNWKPESLCDFGSGIGSVMWAAQTAWPPIIKDYLCIDSSSEMNDMADLLLRRGSNNNQQWLPGVIFRQFLPASDKVLYDLVVSSHSLLELPSLKARLETIDILWRKTSGYLVLVEAGTNNGFQVLTEARDFILGLDQTDKNSIPQGFVFSPCPHDLTCPRYAFDDTPCYFPVTYRSLLPFHKDMSRTEIYSYLVIKKGKRNNNKEEWPRVVRDHVSNNRQVICGLFTPAGQLSEAVITKAKNTQVTHRCAKKSRWGDLLPVKILDKVKTEPSP